MATQLRSGAGKGAAVVVLLLCLPAIALPAAPPVGHPAFGKAFIRVDSIQDLMPQGSITWQVGCESSVKNLPSDTTEFRYTISIQMRTNSTSSWTDHGQILTVTTPHKDGTAKIDTGFLDLATAPAPGNQFRFKLSGSYKVSGPPEKTMNLPDTESDPYTPVLPPAMPEADPGFGTSTTMIQASQKPGGPVLWGIKGNSSVKNLPTDAKSVKVTVVIQARRDSKAAWVDLDKLTLTTPAYDGAAKVDTRLRKLASPPAVGYQYRIKLSGSYTVRGRPLQPIDLPGAESDPHTIH